MIKILTYLKYDKDNKDLFLISTVEMLSSVLTFKKYLGTPKIYKKQRNQNTSF